MRLCRFDDSDVLIHTRSGGHELRTALGVSCAKATHRRKRRDACSTSTATSTRPNARPRIPRNARTRFGNQRSALRASLTFEQHHPLRRRSQWSSHHAPLQGPSSAGAADILPPPPACFISPFLAPSAGRSTHRPNIRARGQRGAPRSFYAPLSQPALTGWHSLLRFARVFGIHRIGPENPEPFR